MPSMHPLIVRSSFSSNAWGAGGNLGLSITQNIIQNLLVKQREQIHGVNVPNIIAAGGADVSNTVPAQLLGSARDAYNFAIMRALVIGVTAAGMAILTSLGMGMYHSELIKGQLHNLLDVARGTCTVYDRYNPFLPAYILNIFNKFRAS
jgi:hypothetical protein